MKLNKIYNEDCIDTMKRMPDGYVDLVVTSPPYDNLRSYGGIKWNFAIFMNVAINLYRIINDGGVLVWIVSDATINGSETGSSLKQALYFMECGFNLHDTMIWTKKGGGAVGSNKCYTQNFEYMFVFTKGKIKTFNLISDVINGSYGTKKAALQLGVVVQNPMEQTI